MGISETDMLSLLEKLFIFNGLFKDIVSYTHSFGAHAEKHLTVVSMQKKSDCMLYVLLCCMAVC